MSLAKILIGGLLISAIFTGGLHKAGESQAFVTKNRTPIKKKVKVAQVEVESVVVQPKPIPEPKQEVVEQPVSRGGDEIEGRRYLGEFEITAYNLSVESCGKTPSHPAYGITASGVKVQDGVSVAVDKSKIPLHSTIFIEGVGVRVAHDTGGAIKGNKIDLYMNASNQECRNFGRQVRKVWIID